MYPMMCCRSVSCDFLQNERSSDSVRLLCLLSVGEIGKKK